MAGVAIDVLSVNDEPLHFARDVEPNLYANNAPLTGVASSEGVTISAIGPNVASGDVFARDSNVLPGFPKNRVFQANLVGGGSAEVWNVNQKLRVDFTVPVSTVSLRAFGGSSTASSYGRLEAYSSDGTLLTRFNTGALTTADATTMIVSRGAGDIAYVIAYGRLDTSVVLDTLQWGAATSATSSSTGAYSLIGLPAGSYHILVTPPAGYEATTPPLGFTTITIDSGHSQATVDFGISGQRAHPFHNLENAYNVNNDAGNNISPIDALMVINYLNSRPGAEGEFGADDYPAKIGFVDVDDDGFCAPRDALMVINYINAGGHLSGGGGEGEVRVGSGSREAASESVTSVTVPTTAAEYYSQPQIQPLSVRGDEQPCTCAQCVGARTDAALASFNDISRSSLSGRDGLGFQGSLPQRQLSRKTSESSAVAHHAAVLSTTFGRSRDRAWHDLFASHSTQEARDRRDAKSSSSEPGNDATDDSADGQIT
jgi:hypothetical protein